jgi:hypothetical protein
MKRLAFLAALLFSAAAWAGPFAIISVGGSSSAAGSDTQIQYNSSGSFAGDAGLTYSATNRALTLGGATVTSSAPVLDLSQTWNNAGTTFTGLKLNSTSTASAAGSLLMDLQLGGSSAFAVRKDGLATSYAADGAPAYSFGGTASASYPALQRSGTSIEAVLSNIGNWVRFTALDLVLTNGAVSGLVFTANSRTPIANDVQLVRGGTNQLWVVNGVNTTYAEVKARGVITEPVAVASLQTCNSGNKGMRQFVTDADSITFLAAVAGGGANNVPVVCDGTGWKIG